MKVADFLNLTDVAVDVVVTDKQELLEELAVRAEHGSVYSTSLSYRSWSNESVSDRREWVAASPCLMHG